jgi:hypothetical protein
MTEDAQAAALAQRIRAGMAAARYASERLQYETLLASGVPAEGLARLGVLPPVPPASEGGE